MERVINPVYVALGNELQSANRKLAEMKAAKLSFAPLDIAPAGEHFVLGTHTHLYKRAGTENDGIEEGFYRYKHYPTAESQPTSEVLVNYLVDKKNEDDLNTQGVVIHDQQYIYAVSPGELAITHMMFDSKKKVDAPLDVTMRYIFSEQYDPSGKLIEVSIGFNKGFSPYGITPDALAPSEMVRQYWAYGSDICLRRTGLDMASLMHYDKNEIERAFKRTYGFADPGQRIQPELLSALGFGLNLNFPLAEAVSPSMVAHILKASRTATFATAVNMRQTTA